MHISVLLKFKNSLCSLKGREKGPKNYRPVTLPSVPEKAMEQIECHHIVHTGQLSDQK